MPVLASTVIGNARRLLLDTNNAVQRWDDATLLAILNEGQKALVLLNPRATAKTAPVALLDGTHQALPADGMVFFGCTRNLTTGGAPGRTITLVAFESINLGAPRWHAGSSSAEVWQFSPDPVDPCKFYVFPSAVIGTTVEVSYAAMPADVPSLNDALSVPDWYAPALVDYVIYRALSENDGDAPARERAQTHYVYFTNQVMGAPAFTPPRGHGRSG
jgi:hypothetical protein